MKKLAISLICLLNMGLSAIYCQSSDSTFTDYPKMYQKVVQYFNEEKYEEAAGIIEKHLDRFPENLMANTFNLALCYGKLEKYEDGIKILSYGLKNNVWYNKWSFASNLWQPFRELDAFNDFLEQNKLKQGEAQKKSKPDMFIMKPEGYSKDKKYPLFIALHGGSGNIPSFKQLWNSSIMQTEFIVAYLQSSEIVSMDGYTWNDMEKAEKEITSAYNKIINEYAINTEEVIIGGFSAGGVASLELIFRSDIPFSGFIILSPPKPEKFSDENVQKMVNKNIRGTIITNPKDPRYQDQRTMADAFYSHGLQYQFVETSATGHWFPENLNEIIDQSILYTRYK